MQHRKLRRGRGRRQAEADLEKGMFNAFDQIYTE